MGLDMYLRAHKYASCYEHVNEEEKGLCGRLLRACGLATHPCKESPSLTISITVAYWRKANAIHAWFVRECQNGVDECQEASVSRDKLIELQVLCEGLLATKDTKQATEVLPPQVGFFFGSTEMDEWYWGDLQLTIDQIKHALATFDEGWSFHYQSSW